MPIGSNFDDFLSEQDCLEEVEAAALKRVLAWKIQKSMEANGLSKTALAKKMHTSRPAIDRLLDPTNTSISLKTAVKAAQACKLIFPSHHSNCKWWFHSYIHGCMQHRRDSGGIVAPGRGLSCQE